MNKNLKNLVAFMFATLVLGSCQTRDVGPTQPASDTEVELAARLVATKAPPAANRVRLRLSVGGTLGQWGDSAYVSGKEILLGRVPRGTQVALDVRAYSLGTSDKDTLWKWFARASQKADSALAIQVLEANIDTVPTSTGLKTIGASSNTYALPAGSRYTLDGSDPKSGTIATGGEIAVPAGKTLRAILRIVTSGDTLVGDTLNVSVPKADPVASPNPPSFSSGGGALPSQLAVGSTILIKADTGAKLVYTIGSSEPKCANASGGNQDIIVIGNDLAGTTLILKAVSCRDTSASSVVRKDVAISKLVAPKAPVVSVNGNALPPELAVGASILVEADSAAKLAYTTDGADPVCETASESRATIKVDSARAGKMLVIRASSCRDSQTSAETKDSVRIAKSDEEIKERVSVPADYTWDNPGATHGWTESVALRISGDASLVWNLRVLPSATTVDVAAWAAVGVPDTASRTGAGTSLGVRKELLASLPVTDSVATVLAVAVLYDSAKAAIDTARLRWNIVVPVTPKPRLSVTRSPDKLVFSWPVTEATAGAGVWYLIGSDTTKVPGYGKGSMNDSFTVPVTNGARVKVGVVSLSSVTGRVSELAILDATASLPPRKPGFAIANLDEVEGKVQIVLDDATRAEQNTTWKAGYASSPSSSTIEYNSSFDKDGKCVVTVNAGGLRAFGVRATRDDMEKDSVTEFDVKRTKEASPGKVLGLAVSRKDSSTVVWKWTRSTEARKYRVFLLRDGIMGNANDTLDCPSDDKKDVGSVDSFKVAALANGATVSLAVVALAGSDSAGGNAEPAISTAVTLNPPPTPLFKVENSDSATGEVTVKITNWDSKVAWSVGFMPPQATTYEWRTLESNTLTKSFEVNGKVSVQVKAVRDDCPKSVLEQIAVKNTNLVAPSAPSGLTWTRASNSVTLKWNALPKHQYKLFWDISSSVSDIDPSATTTNKELDPTNPYVFTLSPGQRVRVALQTVSAEDSTKPSALVYESQSTFATIEPVASITAKLTDPATRTVTFTWAKVSNAVKYRYSSNLESGIKETTSNSVTLQYPAAGGVKDVTLSVQAENQDGVLSTWGDATLHIPQNRGSTNLVDWDIWTKGTILTIQGRASTTITGTAPDSVYISLFRGGSATRWQVAYSQLSTFTQSQTLDATSMNEGRYEVDAQFRWTSSSLKGDTTNIDSRPVRGWAAPVPTANYLIQDGKMKMQVLRNGLDSSSRTGWTLHVLANYAGTWVDIVNNADKVTYPSITDGGFGLYPLGATQLKVYSDSGLNTSVERIVPILPEDSILIGSRYYPIVMFGAKRWITRPMNTPTAANLCSDRTISTDCGKAGRLYTWLEATGLATIPDSGDHEVQGVCPTGWRVPYATDIIALLQTIGPGWTWDNRDQFDFKNQLFFDAGFGFTSSSYSYEGNPGSEIWSDFAGMWAATTGSGGYKQYVDHWYFQLSYISAMGRPPTYVQNNQVFCIEQ